MFWLEMSRDETHGGGDWGFTHSLWAPTHKKGTQYRSSWPFWSSVKSVKAGDIVLHLRGKQKRAKFVGYSTAEMDGYETDERPPNPGQWEYARSFYRVPLSNFRPFENPILLYELLNNAQKSESLRDYFISNKNRGSKKRHIFLVIQSGRLQPLNGAYLSEVDEDLSNILLDFKNIPEPSDPRQNYKYPARVQTAERVREFLTRIGQQEFSKSVRANYGSRCCFPGCSINDAVFLVGAHIARWADQLDLRGEVSNGLCFCLMHDRAFEAGFFTITSTLRVAVNYSRIQENNWAIKHLSPYDGALIAESQYPPSAKVLRLHWERISFIPPDA